MARDKLTRQELGWLLAQEARGAANALRAGVSQLKQPAIAIEERSSPEETVETSLDALEDAIGMLSVLEARPSGRGRRGRIDVAALLCEIAPRARIAIEPGAGTEVFADEADLTRMLYVLVSQTSEPGAPSESASPELSICREDDLVRITVELGPDRSATAEVERRWLSRMAMRLGGRLELEGGRQGLLLPADGAKDQQELLALRQELEQAQQLGEAYARELAEVFSAVIPPSPSTLPPPPATAPARRLHMLAAMSAELGRSLRELLTGLRSDAAALGRSASEAPTVAESLQLRASSLGELVETLSQVAGCPIDDQAQELELGAQLGDALGEAAGRASRHGVELRLVRSGTRWVRTRPGALRLLLRCLVSHALGATPHGGQVVVGLSLDGTRLVWFDDGGPNVPSAARDDLLERRIDSAALGRPGSIALNVALAAAEHLGLSLELEDSPAGGLRVTVSRAP